MFVYYCVGLAMIFPMVLSNFEDAVVDVEWDSKYGQLIERNHTHLRQMSETMLNGIYPGTLWCGKGNIATNYTDLGELRSEDTCCRTHDYCPYQIAAGEKKYGLLNTGTFTRSDCACDKEFYKCLTKAGEKNAILIRYVYFKLLVPNCIKIFTHPKSCPLKYSYENEQVRNGIATCAEWRPVGYGI